VDNGLGVKSVLFRILLVARDARSRGAQTDRSGGTRADDRYPTMVTWPPFKGGTGSMRSTSSRTKLIAAVLSER